MFIGSNGADQTPCSRLCFCLHRVVYKLVTGYVCARFELRGYYGFRPPYVRFEPPQIRLKTTSLCGRHIHLSHLPATVNTTIYFLKIVMPERIL